MPLCPVSKSSFILENVHFSLNYHYASPVDFNGTSVQVNVFRIAALCHWLQTDSKTANDFIYLALGSWAFLGGRVTTEIQGPSHVLCCSLAKSCSPLLSVYSLRMTSRELWPSYWIACKSFRHVTLSEQLALAFQTWHQSCVRRRRRRRRKKKRASTEVDKQIKEVKCK